MKRRTAAIAIATGTLAAPSPAQAHVTVQPTTAPAGAQTVLAVRVPNERDDASTVKVDMKLPPGFASASWEPTPGWTMRAVKQKLSTPIQTDDGPIDEQISEIVWTASSRRDGIAPGEFRDFPLAVLIPGKAGRTLTFRALQTYSNGEVVRWIGAAQRRARAAAQADVGRREHDVTAAGQPGARAGGRGEHGQRRLERPEHRRARGRSARAAAGRGGARRRPPRRRALTDARSRAAAPEHRPRPGPRLERRGRVRQRLV